MADFSRPFASPGVAGQAIFRPATAWNHGTGICEWIAPKRPPAPTAERTTSGTCVRSFDRYHHLAA
jgi:hypothetical protein